MTGVSVVVPARDAAATLPRALRCLAAQDLTEPFEVIVADDGSSDATAAIADAAAVVARVVRLEGAGPGPARDAGAAAARGGLLAFTDADCYPAPDWLRRGLAALAGADLVQGRVEPDPEAPRHPFDRTVTVHRPHGLFESANLLMRRELFERLGGFGTGIAAGEERLPGGVRVAPKPLAEDVFLGWRAIRAGARVTFAPDAVVHHAVFPRGAGEFAAERLRLRHFPHIAAAVPELRERLFWRRWFLNRRTAAFDAAACGVALALARRSPLPLAAAVPYAVATRRLVRHWPQEDALRLGATLVAADALGAAALVRGSVQSRTLVL